MLETADFDSIGNVLPFIDGFVDSFRGTGKNAENIRAQAWYVQMVNDLIQRIKLFVWSGDAIRTLQYFTRRVKIADRKAFKKYQNPNMFTQKWHALHHICDAIGHVGNVETHRERIYKA